MEMFQIKAAQRDIKTLNVIPDPALYPVLEGERML